MPAPTHPLPEPDRRLQPEAVPDPFAPAVSAILFGYYGFLDSTAADTIDEQANGGAGATVPLWLGSLWILRITAVLFAICVAMSILRTRSASLAYGAAGLLSSLGLLAIVVWDQLDTTYFFAAQPLVLLLCAVWNGWSSVATLRRTLG